MSFGAMNEMKSELKKLLWRRESLILLFLLVGYLIFFTARIDKGGTYTNTDCAMQKFEAHQHEMVSTVITLRNRAKAAPTEYIRADFEKAYESYNVRYEFEPFDTIAVESGLTLCFLREVNIVFLLLIVSVLSPVIVRDHECGMYQLLYTTKSGRSGLFKKKLSAAFVLVSLIAIAYTAAVFICIWQKRGLSYSALSAPVQSLEMFYYCPFSLSIMDYLLLLCLVRILAAMLIIGLIFLLSYAVKNSFAVMGCSAIFATGLYYIPIIFTGTEHTLSRLGLFCLLDLNGYLSSYNTVNVFGAPVFSFVLTLLFTLLIGASIISLAYNIFCRERRSHNAA